MRGRNKKWKDRLKGHKCGIFYLRMLGDARACGNQHEEGLLLSVSYDATVIVWDLVGRVIHREVNLQPPSGTVKLNKLIACAADRSGEILIATCR